MSDLLSELKTLRRQCAAMVERLDVVIAQGDTLPPHEHLRPLVVEGRCKEVSQHAIDRFRERTGTTKGDLSIINQMGRRLTTAEEMVLLERYRIYELLSHGRHSRYFRSNDLIFVVEEERILTVHKGQADRWIPLALAAVPAVPADASAAPSHA